MKKISLIFIFLICCFVISATKTSAIFDPLMTPNNFYGIHILFPEEVDEAAKLVNTNGGDWGYVTIPIKADEKSIDRWQAFFDKCALLHIIPIIRISTEGDFSNTASWRIPTKYDVLDFANFLNSLSWPTKNRYIILFNETNRFDEWGGQYPDPSNFAQLISESYEIFKSRSEDFYLILGGLDNASSTDYEKYMNPYEYLRRMYEADFDIFNKIDGFSSHSYPNPAFSDTPNTYNRMGVFTFKFQYDFINARAKDKKLAFITETGWDNRKINENTIASYYDYTFTHIWGAHKDKIVAITPFLLRSEQGQFDQFSFYRSGKETFYHNSIAALPKVKGKPVTNDLYKITTPLVKEPKEVRFSQRETLEGRVEVPSLLRMYMKNVFETE